MKKDTVANKPAVVRVGIFELPYHGDGCQNAENAVSIDDVVYCGIVIPNGLLKLGERLCPYQNDNMLHDEGSYRRGCEQYKGKSQGEIKTLQGKNTRETKTRSRVSDTVGRYDERRRPPREGITGIEWFPTVPD